MDFNCEFAISGILHATVDIHFSVFTVEHGLFVYVGEIYLSNHGLPPTPTYIHHWTSFYMHAYAICYRVAGL